VFFYALDLALLVCSSFCVSLGFGSGSCGGLFALDVRVFCCIPRIKDLKKGKRCRLVMFRILASVKILALAVILRASYILVFLVIEFATSRD
jgi:hypothetical protein